MLQKGRTASTHAEPSDATSASDRPVDAVRLRSMINANAIAAGIVAALLLPMITAAFGYLNQSSLVTNELAVLAQAVEADAASDPGHRSKRDIAATLIAGGTLTCRARIVTGSDAANGSLSVIRESTRISEKDGTWFIVVVERSAQTALVVALLTLLPAAMLGILVFRVTRAYPRRMLTMALNELERRTEAEDRLRGANSLFSAILESTADGIVATDGDGRIVACNTRYLDLWKLSESDRSQVDDHMLFSSLASKVRDAREFLARHQELLRTPTLELTECLELQDGRWFEWTSRPQRIQGEVVGRISTFRDVSDSKRAEVLLSTEKAVLEKVVRGAPLVEALRVVAEAIERESGEMFCAILFCEDGRTGQLNAVTGPSLPAWYSEQIEAMQLVTEQRDHGTVLAEESASAWLAAAPYRALMTRLGVEAARIEPIKGSGGGTIGFVLVHYRHQFSENIDADEQLVHIAAQMCAIAIDRYRSTRELDMLAHYDFLTGLPNRKHFHDELRLAIDRVKGTDRRLALLFLDLDRFKAVNDTLGHAAGDSLLKVVATRIRECVRAHDLVARLSGDEFVVLIEDLGRTDLAAALAGKIAERMTEGITLNGQETFISASVGIALYPNDGQTLEELLKNADAAMYEVKGRGRNGVQFFHSRMTEGGLERMQLEGQLRRALERNEMALHYQPKVGAQSARVVGAEALLRWNHPEHGLILPSKFVPLLEETGLIVDFWDWIIRQVCLDMARLNRSVAMPLDLAVNVSARQFGQPNLVRALSSALRESKVDPARLQLELTESLLMKEPEQASETLHELRELGVGGIAVDDFGTGYSSLGYLKRFPITALKIDRSFVAGIPGDTHDDAIVKAIMALSRSVGLRVTAEGVETELQAICLVEHGCDELQGFYFGRAVPLDQLIATIRSGPPAIPSVAPPRPRSAPQRPRALASVK